MSTMFTPSFNITGQLDAIVRNAAKEMEALGAMFDPEIRPADPRFGDFQANGILPHAKEMKVNPRELAVELVDKIAKQNGLPSDYCSIEIAGPGFINFKLTAKFLLSWLTKFKEKSAWQAGASELYKGKNIVVDYSSPNTAKQMHVGHLRSMVIGEAIQRILRFCGANITRDNHIGDWGTQFGIIIMAIKRKGFNLDDLDAMGTEGLEKLEDIYREGQALTKEDPSALDEARKELVKLQNGDPENMALWEHVNKLSYAAFQEVYKLFNVQFDVVLGESFYRDKVERVYKELTEVGLLQESQGAMVVFHPEHPRFNKQPFIVRKSDGATNYATTDLATALHRLEEFKADEMINVTDGRQCDHFEQLKLTVKKWFKAKHYRSTKLRHVWFGSILGEDGKAIKTRSGEPIRLKDLLSEGMERAYKVVAEKNPDLPEDEKQLIAQRVALGAIRYADLSQDRGKDYVFSWDKLLAFDGNTAPYLMYAIARIQSIFKKVGVAPLEGEENATGFETEQELLLARKLVVFPYILDMAIHDLKPHFICIYLFELAGLFSSFYNADKVIVDDSSVKARRLMLCARTLEVLEMGLDMLGIETLKRM